MDNARRDLGRNLARTVILAACLLSPGPAGAGEHTGTGKLARINQALQQWLRLIEADRPYLLVDRRAGEVRLQHGQAVLRIAPVLVDSLGPRPATQTSLQRHVRRYRPATARSPLQHGPFDWESNLANQATEKCALYFDSGLLIYAAAAWRNPRAPSLKIEVDDLKALYNTAETGMPLVVLPRGWDEDSGDGRP